MSDPKGTAIPDDAPEKTTAEKKNELPDQDLDKVAGGFAQASVPMSQKNIGQSLSGEGRSVVSSIGGVAGNPLLKP